MFFESSFSKDAGAVERVANVLSNGPRALEVGNMRTLLRVAASINAVFQVLLGLVAVASPQGAAGLFQLQGLGPPELAVVRMFGGLLAGSGLLSAIIARSPDAYPGLLVGYALACMLNLTADTAVGLSGEMRFSQLALGMAPQALIAIAIVARLRGGEPVVADHRV